MISTILILFVIVYNENIIRIDHQLTEHSLVVPVTGQVSNRNGTVFEGLLIPSRFSSEIILSKHTEEVQVVTAFRGIFQNTALYPSDENTGFRINSVTNLSLYAEDKDLTIEWLSGYDEDLFNTTKPLVMLSNAIKDEAYWLTDDVVRLELYYFRPDGSRFMSLDYFKSIDLQVAGFFEFESDALQDIIRPQLILSHQFICHISQEEGIDFYSDSASFRVTNPLELNLFIEEMREVGFYSLSVTADPLGDTGDTLLVDDSTFVNGATQLLQTIHLQQRFYPVIFVSIGLIVFFVSYLMLQSRRQELLIFRLLGVSKRSCFFMYLIEQNIIFVLGKIAAVLLSVIFMSHIGIRGLYPLFIAYLFFSIGCTTSLLFMERKSIMIAVSERE